MKTLFLYIVKRDDAPILAGLSAVEWLIRGTQGTPYRLIEDIAEATLPDSEWFAVLTPSTPLVTASYLRDLMREMDRRGVFGVEIGDGFLACASAYQAGFRPKRSANSTEAMTATSASEKAKAELVLYRRIAEVCAQNGAIIPDVDNVRIDALSTVEAGATVEPFAIIRESFVGSGARIGSFSEISRSRIGREATVVHSVVRDSEIGEKTTVGPFA